MHAIRSVLLVSLWLTALVWVLPASAADTVLRSATSLGVAAANSRTSPIVDPEHSVQGAPLRLEYQLITRVETMTQTTREIHAIVNAMPGPGLPDKVSSRALTQRFNDPYDEMLARLDHATQLVADISTLLQEMPSTPLQQNQATPSVALPAAPLPQAIGESQPPVSRRKPPLTPTALVRLAIVVLGVLLALVLVRQLPKLRRKKPEEAPDTASDQVVSIVPPAENDRASAVIEEQEAGVAVLPAKAA